MLQDPSITRISILSRRPVAQAQGHSKAEVILHSDFGEYSPDLASRLASASGVVWALGISQSLVSAAEYEQITHDYALAFVRFWGNLPLPLPQNNEKPRTFVYVSGHGTTHGSPGLMTPRFAAVKGRTEQELLDLTVPVPPGPESQKKEYIANLRVLATRPCGVDPTHQPEIHAYIPTQPLARRLFAKAALPALRAAMPSMISPTREIGEVFVQMAKGVEDRGPVRFEEQDSMMKREAMFGANGRNAEWKWNGGVVSNVEIRRLAGLDK